jgi:hypothetical protein
VEYFGPLCFGIVIGYVTYRSLARSGPTSSISDIAAVIGALGGGVITTLFLPGSESFGFYAFGLVLGFAIYIGVSATIGPKVAAKNGGVVLLGGDGDPLVGAKPGGGTFNNDPRPER